MAETSHGLKLQAAHAIAQNETYRLQLAALRNHLPEDSDGNVEVPASLLSSLAARLGNDSLVLQKMDKKIDDLNNQLFNA